MNTPDGYRGILYLMRGTPTSGKSHLGLRLAEGDSTKVMSTDDYFSALPGGYKANWKPELLFTAHRWNQDRTRAAMRLGMTPIVVDNTNITPKQARPYVEFADELQYWVEIRESDSPWWQEISTLLVKKQLNRELLLTWATKLSEGFEWEGRFIKNCHGVPADTIMNMLEKLRPYTVEEIRTRRE